MKIGTEARSRVARSLLVDGPATTADLAQRLGMTPAGVRRHLDSLEADDFIAGGERPAFGPAPLRGRGRPPKVYSITEAGRESFDQAYDDLAVAALRFLRAEAGAEAVQAFAERRAGDMERRYLPLVSRVPDGGSRVAALVEAMNDDGFAAAATTMPDGVAAIQICQHNCPVAHVAAEFPELCQTETEAIGRLLDTHVTRIATIAHGDGVCTAVVNQPHGIPQRRSAGANHEERIRT